MPIFDEPLTASEITSFLRVLDDHPELTVNGWCDTDDPDYARYRALTFTPQSRAGFKRALQFLEHVPMRQTIKRERSALWWSHVARRAFRRQHDCYNFGHIDASLDDLGIGFISKGIFIAACIAKGITIFNSLARHETYVNLSSRGYSMDLTPMG
jgi:hypothetical protein